VICEATVKLHEIPTRREYRGYLFRSFAAGLEAARRINQSEIPVAMVRLSDAAETRFFQAFSSRAPSGLDARLRRAYLKLRGFSGESCLMLVGHEGDEDAVVWAAAQTEETCKRLGALSLGVGPGERWYRTRFDTPYSRDPMLDRGIGLDTLETATRWSNVAVLHERVTQALLGAMAANMPERHARGIVMAHLSHSYPDGASLYFTLVFPRQLDRDIEQWQALERAASDAIAMNGGTISTDHVAWLTGEKGASGMSLLEATQARAGPEGHPQPGQATRLMVQP
jgi:alkyldihydroxyacetonephosphate synthase